LIDAVRIKLALELEPMIKEQAKKNQQGGQGSVLLHPNLGKANSINTEDEVLKIAGVSYGHAPTSRFTMTARVFTLVIPSRIRSRCVPFLS